MNEREKLAEEKRDLIANLHNAFVEAFLKYKPQPEVAVYALEMAKYEVLKEADKRNILSNIKPEPMKGKHVS